MGARNSITREVSILNSGNSLAGTLFLPGNERPRSALAMLQGSGPTDRDNFGFFPSIRQVILSAGVEVLAWDKPGIGGSTGDWRMQTLTERASEAIEAARFRRTQPELQDVPVGLFGHSQGAWVAPIAAANSPDAIDFVAAQSGPGIAPREQCNYDGEHSMRRDGHPEHAVQRVSAYVRQLLDTADRNVTYGEIKSVLLRDIQEEPCWDYFPILDAEMWDYFRRGWREDPHPRDVLPRVRCPVLAIFGELDHLLPVDESKKFIRRHSANPETATSRSRSSRMLTTRYSTKSLRSSRLATPRH